MPHAAMSTIAKASAVTQHANATVPLEPTRLGWRRLLPTAGLPTIGLAVLLAANLVACSIQQEPASPQEPAVVTQQEQNELRALAFRAEREGDFAVAANAFVRLNRAEPGNIGWVVAAGRCLGRAGQFGDAIDLLEAGKKRFEGDIEIASMLARTLLLQTERSAGVINPEVLWADAAEIAEAVLQTHPDHEDSRLLLAQARYLLGNWDEAERQAEECVKRHPTRAGAHVLLGRIATDNFRRLLAAFAEAKPTDRQEADMVALIHEQRTRADRSFRRAAELDPSRAHPHVALSQLATIDKKPDAARQHLLAALAIDPDVRVDHALLTKDMTWQKRRALYLKLRTQFLSATKLPAKQKAKKAATLHFHEGRALLDGLEFAAARAAFEKSIGDDPSAKNAHYYCFLSAYYLKDYDAAEAEAAIYARASAPGFADVLRALPNSERAQIAAMIQWLGDRAYEAKRIDNSRDLNHVTACLKDSADAWNNHAFLCRETKQFERAYASYQHAIEKEPKSAQLWNDAGVVLHYHLPTAKNLAKARSMYEKALELAQATLADDKADARAIEFAKGARQNAEANLKDLAQKIAESGGQKEPVK